MSREKSFPPTRKKLEKARREGDIAKSRDLTGLFALAAGAVATLMLAAEATQISEFLEKSCLVPRDFHSKHMLLSAKDALRLFLRAVCPTLLIVWLTVLAGELLQAGFWFSWNLLTPKWSRLNFFSGLKRICGVRGGDEAAAPLGLLHDTAKQMLLAAAFAGASAAVCGPLFSELAEGGLEDMQSVPPLLWALLRSALIPVLLLASIAGTAELVIARIRRMRRLRMDAQELRKELRESDGDPETRGLRKQLHEELLLHGILEGVRRARVIVVGKRRTEK